MYKYLAGVLLVLIIGVLLISAGLGVSCENCTPEELLAGETPVVTFDPTQLIVVALLLAVVLIAWYKLF